MKKTILKTLLCFVFASLVQTVFAQQTTEQKIREVYGTAFFANQPDLEPIFVRLLEERVHIQQLARVQGEKYPLLSRARLLDRFNPNLTRDTNFDAANFNVLKYDLEFFARTTQIYRVDNTDYIIVIDPQ